MTTRRALATAAAVLVIAYVVVDIALQLVSPQHHPIGDAESNLAVGPLGWIMNLNFLGRGVMSVCLGAAFALTGHRTRARTLGVALLIAGGVCSALLALFVTDLGPPTTPEGFIHVGVAAAGFALALAAITVLTHWARGAGVRLGRAAAALLVVAWLGFVALVIAAAAVPEVLGLVERLCLVGILGWAFVAAVGVARLRPEC